MTNVRKSTKTQENVAARGGASGKTKEQPSRQDLGAAPSVGDVSGALPSTRSLPNAPHGPVHVPPDRDTVSDLGAVAAAAPAAGPLRAWSDTASASIARARDAFRVPAEAVT